MAEFKTVVRYTFSDGRLLEVQRTHEGEIIQYTGPVRYVLDGEIIDNRFHMADIDKEVRRDYATSATRSE